MQKTNHSLTQLDNELIQLCRMGKKIEAIKIYKESTNASLKDSKKYVEQLAQQNGIKMPEGNGPCFIATACYGDYNAYEVSLLRHYRDHTLMHSKAGRTFVRFYYWAAPVFAKRLERSTTLKSWVRKGILAGIVRLVQAKAFRNK